MHIVHDDRGAIIFTISGPGKDYGTDVLDKEGRQWLFEPDLQNLDPTAMCVDVNASPKKGSFRNSRSS